MRNPTFQKVTFAEKMALAGADLVTVIALPTDLFGVTEFRADILNKAGSLIHSGRVGSAHAAVRSAKRYHSTLGISIDTQSMIVQEALGSEDATTLRQYNESIKRVDGDH